MRGGVSAVRGRGTGTALARVRPDPVGIINAAATGPSRSHPSKLPGKLLLCGPSLFFFFHSLSKQCGLLTNVTLLSLAAHPATAPSAVSDASPPRLAVTVRSTFSPAADLFHRAQVSVLFLAVAASQPSRAAGLHAVSGRTAPSATWCRGLPRHGPAQRGTGNERQSLTRPSRAPQRAWRRRTRPRRLSD